MPPSHLELYRVRVTFDMPDETIAQNVWAWQLTDPSELIDDDQDVVDAVAGKLDEIYEYIQSFLANTVTIAEAVVEAVEWVVDHWETIRTLGYIILDLIGGSGEDMLPHGVAAVFGANTATPKTRARKFIPGIQEENMVDSVLSGPLLAAMGNMGTAWLNPEQVGGVQAYLIPEVLCTGEKTKGTSKILTSYFADGVAGYQRRRKPGVGA
jgi:hypothetical protein